LLIPKLGLSNHIRLLSALSTGTYHLLFTTHYQLLIINTQLHKMKFTLSLLLTALFAFALGLFLDWWSIAIAAFVVAVCIPQRPSKALACGGLGIMLLWAGYSIFLNGRNDGLLASKIASVLPLGGNVALLIFVTSFIGGLIGGMAALTGSYLRRAPARKRIYVSQPEVKQKEFEPTI
jgi:hypothetical protein